MNAIKPYAKAAVALAVPLIGLAVSLAIFDQETGAKITEAVVAIATGLGVYQVANRPPEQPPPRPKHEERRRAT